MRKRIPWLSRRFFCDCCRYIPEFDYVSILHFVTRRAQLARQIERSPSTAFDRTRLMAAGSTAIGFGGLVMHNIEHATVAARLLSRHRNADFDLNHLDAALSPTTIFRIRDIGWPGVISSLLVATASISFVQSITHTTVANSLFMLCAIPFIGAARVSLSKKRFPDGNFHDGARHNGILIMLVEGWFWSNVR